MSVTKLVTSDDLLALGSDAIFDLIEGELVDVTPSFGGSSEISLNMVEIIRPHVHRFQLGCVTGEAGGYLIKRNPDTVVIPAIGFIST